ncbi:MAG: hypothetical protein CMB80_01765 [Flammeovirgaceae bacterium]|nr:hypothetical protein [Flammeovirgaceae bacterium]|tara:strand:+ start:623 stop:907 length:285 start_codon:yes stop_codon:yes gene_type:complete
MSEYSFKEKLVLFGLPILFMLSTCTIGAFGKPTNYVQAHTWEQGVKLNNLEIQELRKEIDGLKEKNKVLKDDIFILGLTIVDLQGYHIREFRGE